MNLSKSTYYEIGDPFFVGCVHVCVCSDLCISGRRAFRMLLWGLFIRYRPVSVVWMCLMGLVLTW